ncbi:LuxR C-terminal-related transcriptional regulator [Kitasatospora sp. CM 4170]|uniref:LuxR C-terminal-related transcriptional regulator n=1 Tax=Kitasatospora aburaviensis TaxID=67265 RepID=A0ABW1F2X3_9ACTN|nr:LuxR C-terminal-related transcriptional regulator [Kitasatospora sp. CM 4170]WNM47400.1 LuxR C-terminal-related transcriptional regulator [Kitasatospora sp. CM 4170]
MGRIRVLVVDDHRIFAEALAAALAAEPDVEVGAAGSAAAAERALERAAVEGRGYDVVLIDADLGADTAAAGARKPRRPGADPPEPARRRPSAAVPAPRRPAIPPAHVPPAHPASAHAPQAHLPPATHPAATPHQPAAHSAATPAPDGITLLARVRRGHPALRAIVLATADDPHRAARALHAGATGWVAKESSLARLLAVIRGVLRDETHLPPALLTGVIRELTTARRDRTESERLVDTLTPREKEILRCMVAGLGRQAVAERLYLSPHTVRTHMQNVLGKLGVHSTLAAVAVARRAGVSPSEPAAPTAPPSVASTTAPGAG